MLSIVCSIAHNTTTATTATHHPSNSVSNNDDIKNYTKATVGSSENSQISFREHLLKLSNIASLLCAVDCTVLPIITVVLPFLWLGTSSATAERLHELGHSLAIYFVLPVGGLASTMNYLNHNKKSLLALSLIGLSCVYAANGHGGPILSRSPHSLAHSLHCGTILHRVTNIMGCAFLLSSNHLGRKISGCGSKDCGMDHGHAVDAECGSHRRHDWLIDSFEDDCFIICIMYVCMCNNKIVDISDI